MTDFAPNDPVTVANLLRRLDQGWNHLQRFISGLSPAQLTEAADAAGWTVKDHLMHIALWEEGIISLLEGGSQQAGMQIDQATWDAGFERINAVLQERHHALPLAEVQEALRRAHTRLRSRIETLKDDDLLRPYRHYDPASTREEPIIGWIAGNSYEHYEEHLPWMAAISGVKDT